MCRRTKLARSTVYELMGRSQFPKARQIQGTWAVRWLDDEITERIAGLPESKGWRT